MMPLDFVLVGVGGQGILLASDILCQVGMASDYDVKKTDVHGMAQRGGSVISHVRMAQKVFSPVVSVGEADFLLAFEKLEACRWVSYLHREGKAVVNDESIPTLAALSPSPRKRSAQAGAAYPADEVIRKEIGFHAGETIMVSASKVASDLGNIRVANVVLLGALSRFLPFSAALWKEAIAARVPPRFLLLNEHAFEAGRQSQQI